MVDEVEQKSFFRPEAMNVKQHCSAGSPFRIKHPEYMKTGISSSVYLRLFMSPVSPDGQAV